MDLLKELFQKYGLWPILLFFVVAIVINGWTYYSAEPGTPVSLLWGLTSHTKPKQTFERSHLDPIQEIITVDWPSRVWWHEAVVGGKVSKFDSARDKLILYVCLETEAGPQCFLQSHAQKPVVKDGSWEAFARFSNEWPELLHGASPIDFRVVAGVLAITESDRLPPTVAGSAGDLVDKELTKFPNIAVSNSMKVERIVADRSKCVIRAIRDRGNPPILIPLPRAPRYSICPPVTLEWSSLAQDVGTGDAYLEVWHDSKKAPAPESAASYTISEWPAGVLRIEVKISEFRGRGPYDSVYLENSCAK